MLNLLTSNPGLLFLILWFGLILAGVLVINWHKARRPRRIQRVSVRGKEEWR